MRVANLWIFIRSVPFCVVIRLVPNQKYWLVKAYRNQTVFVWRVTDWRVYFCCLGEVISFCCFLHVLTLIYAENCVFKDRCWFRIQWEVTGFSTDLRSLNSWNNAPNSDLASFVCVIEWPVSSVTMYSCTVHYLLNSTSDFCLEIKPCSNANVSSLDYSVLVLLCVS